MSAALKLNQGSENLSQKPPLGENRPRLRLVWENPKLSADGDREKSKARLSLVSGQTLYVYVLGNPLFWTDPLGLRAAGHHIYPREFWEKNPDISKGVKGVYDKDVIKPGIRHGWSRQHKAYNRIAKEAYEKFCKTNGTPKNPEDAKAFLDYLRNIPSIKKFNDETASGGKLSMPDETQPLPDVPKVVETPAEPGAGEVPGAGEIPEPEFKIDIPIDL